MQSENPLDCQKGQVTEAMDGMSWERAGSGEALGKGIPSFHYGLDNYNFTS